VAQHERGDHARSQARPADRLLARPVARPPAARVTKRTAILRILQITTEVHSSALCSHGHGAHRRARRLQLDFFVFWCRSLASTPSHDRCPSAGSV
jgi:hypothetical protein